jgi:hypothetical protein
LTLVKDLVLRDPARMQRGRLFGVILLVVSWSSLACGQDPLIVHEWGTFTALQDEQGNAIGGINTDAEPVPGFVHDCAQTLLIREVALDPKGLVGKCHLDVTLRLETPVIYFHPRSDWKGPVNVSVQFHGGWLTQFFPDAVAVAPGISKTGFGPITSATVGSLAWNGLTLDGGSAPPATNARVWTTPRQAKASTVQTAAGEAEKFLFYRGVAHSSAPLRVQQLNGELVMTANGEAPQLTPADVPQLWLADIHDGAAAFRLLHPLENSPTLIVRTPSSLSGAEYSDHSMADLKSSLRAALIKDGLYPDEADALLGTWEASYFKSPGLRLFFLVPQKWTDNRMPLTVSPAARVTRVMVGRVEIVTSEQRRLLAQLASGKGVDQEDQGQLTKASNDSISKVNRAYEALGRFRNALLLDEQQRRPTAALSEFIRRNGLEPYQIDGR